MPGTSCRVLFSFVDSTATVAQHADLAQDGRLCFLIEAMKSDSHFILGYEALGGYAVHSSHTAAC